MRVVLDTNIVARAALPRGPAVQVFQLLIRPPHVLLTSQPLLDELDRVLRYPRMQALHNLDDTQLAAFVAELQRGALLVQLPSHVPKVASDPDDDAVIATATEGAADVLCTWDKHFLDPDVQFHLATFGIRVLRDSELLPLLQASQQ